MSTIPSQPQFFPAGTPQIWPSQTVRTFIVTLCICGIACIITLNSPPLFTRSSMLLFVAAVTVSSWYGGLLGGVLATGLSAFLWTLLVVPPTLSLSLGEFADILRLTLFSLLAMLITGLNAARIRSEKDQLHIQHRLNLALELGGIGVWDYEVTKGTLWVSEGLSTILRASHPIDQFGKLVAIIHPDDRRILFDIISSPPEDQTSREITFRVVGKDSVSRRVNGRVECFVDRAGDLVRVVGVLEEVPGE